MCGGRKGVRETVLWDIMCERKRKREFVCVIEKERVRVFCEIVCERVREIERERIESKGDKKHEDTEKII